MYIKLHFLMQDLNFGKKGKLEDTVQLISSASFQILAIYFFQMAPKTKFDPNGVKMFIFPKKSQK